MLVNKPIPLNYWKTLVLLNGSIKFMRSKYNEHYARAIEREEAMFKELLSRFTFK